jgi:hypothetical protein
MACFRQPSLWIPTSLQVKNLSPGTRNRMFNFLSV